MPGMFYSQKETQEKLNINEDQIKALVRQGKLREFRDGPNLLFKVVEVDSLKKDPSISGPEAVKEDAELQLVEEEISLVLDEEEAPKPAVKTEKAEPVALSSADTQITTEGIDVLSDEDSEYQLAGDTQGATIASEEFKLKDEKSGKSKLIPADTALISEADTASLGASETAVSKPAETDEASIKEIEDDVNLDTFGSGSGLLDLSLQADDTSLGGILDEIYTAPENGAEHAQPSDVAAATETMFPDAGQPAFGVAGGGVYAGMMIEPEPDTKSNILGMLLFLPVLVVIYTFIVVFSSDLSAKPAIFTSVKDVINYIIGGIAVLVLIVGIFCSLNLQPGPPKPKVEKAPKPEKPKKEKPKKEKKTK